MADGESGILDGVVTNITGKLTVGTNAPFTFLLLTNGSIVTGTGDTEIGMNSTGNSNRLMVTGAGSVWACDGNFIAGDNGSYNELDVLAGAVVTNSLGYLGKNNPSRSNLVLVSGSNSAWVNRSTLYLGNFGSFNQLIISNGAMAAASYAYMGYSSTGSNNTVCVTGGGSLWTVANDLFVGQSSSFNQVLVTNGGTVGDGRGYIGNVGSVSNTMTVTGISSTWANNGEVNLRGNFSQLLVTDGGTVSCGSAILGWYGSGNLTLVTGSGSLLTNRSTLTVGYQGYGNQLIVTNGGVVACDSLRNGGSGQRMLVTGSGSLITNCSDAYAGYVGASNQLCVMDGATLADNTGYIDGGSFQPANVAVVAGTNALWTNRSDLYVGQAGVLNQLLVTNAGSVVNSNGYIGYNTGSNTNTVTVADPGSLWTNRSDLYVGYSGMRNRLYIRNGGTVANARGYIGFYSSSASNLVVVAGTNSLWTNGNSLYVGMVGPFNQLLITNGATVADSWGCLAQNSLSFSNRVVVADPGSVWRTSGPLYCGFSGKGNELVVSNSGSLLANDLYLGHNDPPMQISTSNTLTVAGGNVIVTNALEANCYGTIRLDAGFLSAGTLRLYGRNQGKLLFNGGTLRTRTTTSPNATPLVIGNGRSAAVFEMADSGAHTFAGGVVVASNATLRGVGTVSANVSVADGGAVSPGSPDTPVPSTTQISISGNLVLSNGSATIIRLDAASGSADNFAGLLSVTYGGTLQLTNIAGTLDKGSAFQLFSAGSYAGAFANISPPAPGPDLKWNLSRLNVDGVLRVLAATSQPPCIATAVAVGGNLQIYARAGTPYDPCVLVSSTNLAAPLEDWETRSTNCFDGSGGLVFTNGVAPGEPQRYFRLRVK